MASAFGHALVAFTIGKTYSPSKTNAKFILTGMLCSVFPDADVITFQFGVNYDDFLGHRGFFHSLFFAFLFSVLVTFIFYRKYTLWSKEGLMHIFFFFLCVSSHSLLDMLTNGGRGVAIFAPFDNTRYFFPWRPIKVSPISVVEFFSETGMRVVKSELLIIGLPCLVWLLSIILIRKRRSS